MEPRWRILIPDAQYPDDAEVERTTAGPEFGFEVHREREAGRVPAAAVTGCAALMAWHELPIDAALVGRLARCRVIVRAGVGYDHIDIEAAALAGIPVCNTPDYGTSEVADHAMAQLLALRRGIASYHDILRADPAGDFRWELAPLVRRLRGSRLGIVGLGRIGTATALRAKAFDIEVLFFDPYVTRGQELALGITRVESLEALLGAVDAVSLHVPLTAETRGLFDAAALAAVRPHAVLINTSRGAVVDLEALRQALEAGDLAGAALDVLPVEPPDADEPLIRAYREQPDWLRGRLLISPHAAWYSAESQHDARRLATETLVAYLRDGRLRNCVNAHLLPDHPEA